MNSKFTCSERSENIRENWNFHELNCECAWQFTSLELKRSERKFLDRTVEEVEQRMSQENANLIIKPER